MLLLLYLLMFGRQRTSVMITLVLVILEIAIVNTSIALNGAASNPFSSILLVPLVLGLMLLPVKLGLAILVLSITGQVLQLIVPPVHHHGDMMQQHAQGMIISFALTSLLVTAVVLYLRAQLNAKSAAIQQLRERQLRDEQLLAIGTAAAQLTHDAATPVQTMRLLLEELQLTPTKELLAEFEGQFIQLESLLKNWRNVADDVREARLTSFTPDDIVRGTRHLLALTRPEASIQWSTATSDTAAPIEADRTLIPALTSIIINACDAAQGNTVSLSVHQSPVYCEIVITNPVGSDNPLPAAGLGSQIVESQTGLGLGAVISNATVEKFGGSVTWKVSENIVTTSITLPVKTS